MSTQPTVGSPTQLPDSQAAAENAYADSGSSPPASHTKALIKGAKIPLGSRQRVNLEDFNWLVVGIRKAICT